MKISNENFPRVLIVSADPFNRSNNTGITLSNLFKGWDKNNLAQIYMSEKMPSTEVCNNYFCLKPKVAFFDYYLRRKILFSFNRGETGISTLAAGVTLSDEKRNFKNIIHLNFRAIADFSPLFLPSNLFKWINEFNPDLIYSFLGTGRLMSLTNTIASKIKKPIVPHFMDDWPSTFYTQNELGGLARKIFNKRFKRSLLNSNGGLCISESMANEYNIRYQLPFTPFANCVEDALFCPPVNTNYGKEFTLMYIGGLHLDRWKSILDISEAIEQLNKDGKKIILKIFSLLDDIKLYKHHFIKFPSTTFEGYLDSDQVPLALKTATLLIHIESFEENYVKFTKLSLSTKIPQYMAAGKPILAYGPKILASIQHIMKSNAGRVVSEKNIKELTSAINQLYNNKELLFMFATNGFNYAKKNNAKSVNLEFLNTTLKKYSKA